MGVLFSINTTTTMRSNVRRAAPLIRSAIQFQRRSFSVSNARQAQYGFIGLGQMGYNMARNLQAKLPSTDTIRVYDINAESVDRFANDTKALSTGASVQVAATAREAAEDSETTITVLPEPTHVNNVFGQILKPPLSESVVSNPDRLFIDSLLSRVEPILLMMGKKVIHCGPQGAGLSGKLANNYLLAINNIATAEAMNLGIKWGLDPKVLANLINVSTGKCWPSEINNPVKGVLDSAPSSRDYKGGFGISLIRKDLNLAIIAAAEAGAKLELGERAKEVYESAEQQEDCKGRDFSVVYRYIGGAE